MSLSKTLLLGFIAGVTIVFGLPIGRLRRPAPGLRLMLNAIAVGVLLFLVWDVLSAAWEPIDAALAATHERHRWPRARSSGTARCSPAGSASACWRWSPTTGRCCGPRDAGAVTGGAAVRDAMARHRAAGTRPPWHRPSLVARRGAGWRC